MSKKVGLPNYVKFKHDTHFVDEISVRTRTEIIRNIPFERINPNTLQPRKDHGDLSELAESIKEKGILEPILVRPKNGQFEIIAGDTRVHEVVLESRPEYIIDEHISKTRRELEDRQVEIGIGLESSNDEIRRICVNKGFSKGEFQNALLTARAHNIGTRAYILVKPPFLTERDAIIDASNAI